MKRRVITIPPNFARVLSCNWDIDWRGQGAGDANDGSSRVIYNAFPRWIGAPQLFLAGAQIAQWRALKSHAQGRVGMYRMQMFDPAGFAELSDVAGAVSFSDGRIGFLTAQGLRAIRLCRLSAQFRRALRSCALMFHQADLRLCRGG